MTAVADGVTALSIGSALTGGTDVKAVADGVTALSIGSAHGGVLPNTQYRHKRWIMFSKRWTI